MPKKKEGQLEYQNLFKAIFEQSAFPMQIFSTQGEMIEANHAWEILFNVRKSEVTHYNIFQDPQVLSGPMIGALKKALEGETVEVQALYYDPQKSMNPGRGRWLESWIYPVLDHERNVQQLAIIHKDVSEKIETELALVRSASERKNTDEKLKLMAERLGLAVKAGKIGVWDWIPGTEEIQWDETAENIYGAIPGLLPKTVKSFNELVHPEDRDQVYLTITEALRNKKSYRVDYRLVRYDGNIRWVQMTGISLYDEKDSPYHMMGTVMDITDRIEAIKTRDEFVSIASHELKTPLQTLILQNQMRKRNIIKGMKDIFQFEKIEQMVDTDLRHLARINRLIDDMLDISKIRSGKINYIKERVEFSGFIHDVLERFRPQLEAGGSYLSYELCSQTLLELDPYRIEQVVVNLLTNALKYGAGKPIKVNLQNLGGCVRVSVSDQGPGIKEEDHLRIFERFERAGSSNHVSGLGLGLYISKQIVEQNNGRIYVQSQIGQGSTFIMELPLK